MRARHSLIAVAALSVLALAGCDKETAGAPIPGAPGANQPAGTSATNGGDAKPNSSDPKALLANAAKTSHDSGTYKFEYKMTSNSTEETGGMSSTGEVDTKAGKFKGETTMDAGGGNKLVMTAISDGKNLYMKSNAGGSGKWLKTNIEELQKQLEQMGGSTSKSAQSQAKDPMSYLDKLKDYASSTPDGTDTIRGQSATRYKLVVDREKVLAGDNADKDPVAIIAATSADSKIWLDSKGRLVQFSFTGSQGGTAGEFSAQMYDYDVPVNIEIPTDDQVETK
jgi:hypothetical protein